MRFPLSLSCSMAGYLLRQRFAGRKRFPLVLMLEPLHGCNLSCAGCGRIREYAETISQRMSIAECLEAVKQCGAPVVSVCGGEPLIYPGIEGLVGKLVAQRKHVYLCTNGWLLADRLAGFPRSGRLMFNVHLDGLESTHDQAAGRPGVFRRAIAGIVAAKRAGFRVFTNTTIYRQTGVQEIAALFEHLARFRVDGLMISPAYGYQAVQQASSENGGLFMTRQEIHAWFCRARPLLRRFKLVASPLYLEFLCGQRTLPCAAWASPTRNVRGWKGPCYLITEAHYASFQELLRSTDWERLGPGRDPRCEHCLVHCGFEPAAVLAAPRRLGDAVSMAVWQIT